jgi:hypothetical protein
VTPRLDRLVEFDQRSRAYPIRALVADKAPRSYHWSCDVWNDQGAEGACVGFAWSHELSARPVVQRTTETEARAIYHRARMLDVWPGENYEGTSVIAGAKAVQERGGLVSYRWAFGLDDLLLSVGYRGPVVLGVNWYSGMWDTDAKGYIQVGGQLLGGHALLCRGVNIPGRYFTLRNSWGQDWGVGGDCRISFDHMARLLHEQGEACVPVRRV